MTSHLKAVKYKDYTLVDDGNPTALRNSIHVIDNPGCSCNICLMAQEHHPELLTHQS